MRFFRLDSQRGCQIFVRRRDTKSVAVGECGLSQRVSKRSRSTHCPLTVMPGQRLGSDRRRQAETRTLAGRFRWTPVANLRTIQRSVSAPAFLVPITASPPISARNSSRFVK
ncbi:hypothetical protein PoB_001108700 [Plakobranchus ocellatus]|uniref:Uncharacterized protein n=1 Tax=Plakobranchus ocellatus TaxID=259542 RepID=A0AAV3YQ41_9GAST|nr:hypothetical protein PoB_001108700 [Plakobranchus ocellatus]